MANITVTNPTELREYFEQEPPRIIGEPRRYFDLAKEIARVSTPFFRRANKLAKVDVEGYPLPLHEGFAMNIDEYDLGVTTTDTEDFDFDSYMNSY